MSGKHVEGAENSSQVADVVSLEQALASGRKARGVEFCPFAFSSAPSGSISPLAFIQRGHLPVVPAVVCAEWWRGCIDIREEILAAVSLENMPPQLCRATGVALAAVRGASLADAAVMASAALRGGGVVYTADPDDLGRLQAYFPTVRLIAV